MSKMKQPWQQGPLSSLFAQPKSIWQRDNTVHCIGMYDHLTMLDDVSAKPKAASSAVLGKQRIRTARMINDEDDFRRVALGRFKTMILVDLTSTRLGKSLQTFAGTLCTNDELSQIFSDVFSPKATGTIIKRCNSMWRFYHWLQLRGGGSPFCQSENILYEYISQLRSQAGPTAPSQFVESFRFCDGLFGLDKVPVDLSLSSRVVGAAHSSFMTKRIRRPAELLTVSEITELERLCFEGEPNHIRVISGHLFFSFMSGARWHDTMYIIDTEVSESRGMFLMEASTERHKSSRGKEQQMELLPFTALGQAMHEEPWVKPWNEARHLEGCSNWNHFLRSWSESRSVWSLGKMSTAEATCWLRELLEPVAGKQRAEKLTVHGLKATLCSWAAKSLMFSPDEQLALGHHVHPQYKSAMIYSRDNQIRLCTKLYFMFRKLREGGFHPDRPRVERLFSSLRTLQWSKWQVKRRVSLARLAIPTSHPRMLNRTMWIPCEFCRVCSQTMLKLTTAVFIGSLVSSIFFHLMWSGFSVADGSHRITKNSLHQISTVPKLSCVRIVRKLTKLTIDRMISSKAKEPFALDVQRKNGCVSMLISCFSQEQTNTCK